MKNTEEIGKYLRSILKTAKKLGLLIMPGGGYASSYHNINNLPKYEVGLFGAITIIEGCNARDILQKRFSLTFDETQDLESGFNSRRSKKTEKRESALEKLGSEIGKEYGGAIYHKYALKDNEAPQAPRGLVYSSPQHYTDTEWRVGRPELATEPAEMPETAVAPVGAVAAASPEEIAAEAPIGEVLDSVAENPAASESLSRRIIQEYIRDPAAFANRIAGRVETAPNLTNEEIENALDALDMVDEVGESQP